MSYPKGEQLVVALLFCVGIMGSTIIFQYKENRHLDEKIEKCEQSKQVIIENSNKVITDFLIDKNKRLEVLREKLDSLNFVLLKINKK
jgi:hypothetical protein